MTSGDLHLYVRVDADERLGAGHFMRCLSLAQWWQEAFGPACFIGRFPESLRARLAHEGIAAVRISAPYPDDADLEETLAAMSTGSPVVIDGYHFDARYHDGIAHAGHWVLVVDDNAHLDRYGGHALLNQNIYATDLDYADAPGQRLLGTNFALLSRNFRSARRARHAECVASARNLLVTLGGADPDNDTETMLRALAARGTDLKVRAVAGAVNPNVDSLRECCDELGDGVELLVDTREMPSLMAWADFAVSAAGTTSWELAYMGVPAVLVAIAGNQERIGAGLADKGAAEFMGTREGLDWGRVAETILALAADPEKRRRLMTAGRTIVDGDGAIRVAAVLASKE